MNHRSFAAKAAALLVVSTLTALASCGGGSTPAKAVATTVVGKVTVAYPGTDPVALNAGDEVTAGAVITTDAASAATIQLSEVGIVRISENSRLQMKALIAANGATELSLESGSVFSRVIKKPGMEYRVQAPTLVASVRGTEFMVVAEGIYGGVLVREGTVAVATPADKTEQPVTVKKRAAVSAEGKVVVIPQHRFEELVLEKHALQPYIENLETKKPEEIQKVFKKVEIEERKIDNAIAELKLTAREKLKKEGKPLVKLFLKDGSQIVGSVEEVNEKELKLNTGEGVIDIPKGDIRRRVPEQ